MADAAVSLGVVVAGAVILLTGWAVIDALVSLGIVVVIMIGTWGLLKNSVNLALDAAPNGVEVDQVRDAFLALPGVSAVHDLHIWGLSTTDTALTAHRLEGDGSAGEDQQKRIAQGGQHGGLAVSIGALGPRRAPRQPGRAPGHGQAQDVGQVVTRIGHQGRRIGPESGPELAGHEGQVDDQADSIAPVAGVHRSMMVPADPMRMAVVMSMPMTMTMAMRMVVARVRVVVMVVCVIVRHATPLGPPAASRQRQRT
jgi:hypothetical protein